MRHKIKIVFSVIIMTLVCAFGLFACGDRGRGNGDSDANNHTAKYYNVDENSHWKICEDCGKTYGKGTHNFDVDGYCTVCDYTKNYTDGLVFDEINDGDYSVLGISDRAVSEITVPTYYQGKPVTSVGPYAFKNCIYLTSVKLPNSLSRIWIYAFENCISLTSIEIPSNVTSIDGSAFFGCAGLTSITIPNGITNIEMYSFSACSSLTSIEIPSSVTSIGSSAFSRCSSLTSIIIPNGVTSIGSSAFFACGSLMSIEIPNSVTSIGTSAFFYCRSLTRINYNGTRAQWLAIDKGVDWNYNMPEFTVTCTDGSLIDRGI